MNSSKPQNPQEPRKPSTTDSSERESQRGGDVPREREQRKGAQPGSGARQQGGGGQTVHEDKPGKHGGRQHGGGQDSH